jgi:serine/threonine protein kinase
MNNKNIIKYHSQFVDDGKNWIEMDLADGGNLEKVITEYRKKSQKEKKIEVVPESEIFKYFVQIADTIG